MTGGQLDPAVPALRALVEELSRQRLSARLDESGPFPLLWVHIPYSHSRYELVLVDAAGRFRFDGGDQGCPAGDVAGAATVIASHVWAQSPGSEKPGAWSRQ